jgi:transcriptional regulator with XRE-family HTH domain
MTSASVTTTVGPLLRQWRRRRRLSQMDLAADAGVSTRHLSFVETGRSRPSPGMVLQLADRLDVPLRDRNHLLLAAGYAPLYDQHELDDPEMEPVRAALRLILDGHDPYPAIVVDRAWEMLAANRAVDLLTAGVAPELLEPPVNVLRVSLHPDGVAPRIANLGEWRAHLLERLGRQIALSGDPALETLLEELRGYPAPDHDPAADHPGRPIAVPLRLRSEAGELAFISTVATFGTAVEVTASELSIESFFPADRVTAETVRTFVERLPPRYRDRRAELRLGAGLARVRRAGPVLAQHRGQRLDSPSGARGCGLRGAPGGLSPIGQPELRGNQLVGPAALLVTVGDRQDRQLIGPVLGRDLLEAGPHGGR